MAKAKKEQDAEIELDLGDEQKAEDTNDKAEIQVDDDAPEVAEPSDAEKKVEELKAELARRDEESKRNRERAERAEKERNEALVQVRGSQNEAVTAKEREIVSAKAAADAAVAAYEEQYEQALEAGDSKKMREVNTALQRAIVQQSKIDDAKENFAAWKKQQEEVAQQPKQSGVTDATREWIGRNPRFNSDPDFKAEATAAHFVALQMGYVPDSPAYFNYIDKRVEKAFPVEKADAEEEQEQPKKRETTFSAPPSRGGGGDKAAPTGKKVYKLTAEEVEAAEFMGMTPVQYAEYKEQNKGRKQ